MATQFSSTPIAPKGLGPGSVLLLIMLLLGFGAFYWLSHNPNALDAFSDLKRMIDAPTASPPPPSRPSGPQMPPAPDSGAVGSQIRREEERMRKKLEEELARLEKEVAETKEKSPDTP